ncbi:MAG: DUF952 domain-containing protein [Pseudomonadota bacterium]
MLIYKILTSQQWNDLQSQGETRGAPIDVADGFVHFSTAGQVAETAAKHFADQDDLQVLAVNPESLGDALKWEPSRGGDLFPHLYAPLRLKDVTWSQPLPLIDGKHRFPVSMV